MGGQHKHLGNLHMGRSAYGVEAHIGDVVARQGLNAVVNMTGALFVTMESDVGEIGSTCTVENPIIQPCGS